MTYKQILKISLSASLAIIIEPLAGLIDTALIGHWDTQKLAALALSVAVFISIGWIFNFLVHTVTNHVGGALGRNQSSEVASSIWISLVFALLSGVLAMAFVYLARDFLLAKVMGASPVLMEDAVEYYMWRLPSIPFVLLMTSLVGCMRGLQKIAQTLIPLSVATAVNAVLSYVLVYHYGWGLKGAAIGTTIGAMSGCMAGLLVLPFPL